MCLRRTPNPILELAKRFQARATQDFPTANQDRVRKFVLDYLKYKGPRLSQLVTEEMLWPSASRIPVEILAEDAATTLQFLREGK